MTRDTKARDWYDIELESVGIIGISIQTQQLERIGQFLNTLHCEKGGCIYGDCPVWILERLVACEPLGLCDTCDEGVVIPLEKAIEHYQDPNVAIYCCEDCREAMEGDYSEDEEDEE